MCYHNNHLAVDKNWKGYQFKRELSINSTIWPRSLFYHFMNRNGHHFDSVGCYLAQGYLAQVTPGVTDTYRSHRISLSLQFLNMINRRLIFLLRQKTCWLFFVSFFVPNYPNSSLGLSRFLLLVFFSSLLV